MTETELLKILRSKFSILNQSDLINRIVNEGKFMIVPEEQTIMSSGTPINVIPLVLEGAVKVSREDNSGKEVFLYHITEGQSCAMTLTSCLKREQSSIKAVTKTTTKLIALPVDTVYSFTKNYSSWTSFILKTYGERFSEILDVVDSVCFQNMDVRLFGYLRKNSQLSGSDTIEISHAQIGEDLGTRREVISRLLKQMENRGYVKLLRGKIKLLELSE